MQLLDLIEQAEVQGLLFPDLLDREIEIDINDMNAVSGETRSIAGVDTSFGTLRLKLV